MLVRFFISFLFTFTLFYGITHATVYLSYVRDLLSTSAPGAQANQTITFTLNQEIPAGGAFEISFDGGGVIVPASGFDYGDIDVGFSASRGGPYTQRPLSSIASPGTDGVTITAGTNGSIRFDMNTTVGIPAGNDVEVRIGTHATYGATGDTPLTLTSATGSYPITITTYDVSDNELDYGQTRIAVIEQVTIGPIDTTDQTPPSIVYASPTGLLQVGTRGVELTVQTDEIAECRYATSSMSYTSMPYTLYGTTTGLTFWHFAQETGLEDDTTYTYYIRCIDYRLNETDPDYILEFTIGIAPGSASSTATSTGTGTGTNTGSSTASSTGSGTGTGTGTGTGSSGSGSGSSSGNGSGGGSGGSSGSGTKLPQADIRIDGWAYPGATVSFVRDGVLTDTDTAGGEGEFSSLTEGLDRGSYSFSIYAVDAGGVRSATFSTTLWLRSETLNTLSNIMLPPTVSVTENSVQPGVPLAVSGYSAPNADVTVWLRPRLAEVSSADVIATTTAVGNGAWSLSVPTTGLPQGTYELVAQAKMPDSVVESDKSARKTIGVGVQVEETDCGKMGDLNCDGSVNLVDFSILVFNWNTTNSVADINSDGIVSLPDFSVMLYYWTG